MGSAVLNHRMLPAGRLLVSYRTSGSLNRPLAALTSGAHTPFLRKPPGAFGFYVGFCEENPSFRRKMGSAVLNRRMLPAGRLLVSYRTSGSLNRPLAALTSGARAPFLRKPLGLWRII